LHDGKKELLQMQLNLEMMKLSQQQGISLDQVKSQLAQTTMKLNVQKELSAQALIADSHGKGLDHAHESHKQVLTPPDEPIGRAHDGQAYAE
jgi:hypothetical protein